MKERNMTVVRAKEWLTVGISNYKSLRFKFLI